ncbi:MAG: hypothetical protein OEV76_01625 [Anaerolineae bacterium]|nr:hypothetical protein [Anaerolineae bacterium]
MAMKNNLSALSKYSSLLEKILEHKFIGEVMHYCWNKKIYDIEISRPEVDNSGTDVLISRGELVRHVQLKASYIGAKTAFQKVNIRLGDKPSGCVVWMLFDPKTLQFKEFRWFGNPPGKKLPDISNKKDFPIAPHSKGNAQGEKKGRPNIRKVNKGKFDVITTSEEIIIKLIG